MTTAIDVSLMGELISGAKTLLGLFTEFPINIFLYGGIAGVMFGLIRKAKRTSRG